LTGPFTSTATSTGRPDFPEGWVIPPLPGRGSPPRREIYSREREKRSVDRGRNSSAGEFPLFLDPRVFRISFFWIPRFFPFPPPNVLGDPRPRGGDLRGALQFRGGV
jgi:hypothetical protein